MTEQRRVQHKEDPQYKATVLAKYTAKNNILYYWLQRDGWTVPQNWQASNWEDIPPEPPQVGEIWAYPHSRTYGFRCVAVTDDSWSFVLDSELPESFTSAPGRTAGSGGLEKTHTITFYTRKLPETDMTKVEN